MIRARKTKPSQTFAEICDNKLSVAIRVMVRGLMKAQARDDFTLNMATYGRLNLKSSTCVGCAATATMVEVNQDTAKMDSKSVIQRVRHAAIDNNSSMLECIDQRSWWLDHDPSDINVFEEAVDSMRNLEFDSILYYFGMNHVRDWVSRISDFVEPGRVDIVTRHFDISDAIDWLGFADWVQTHLESRALQYVVDEDRIHLIGDFPTDTDSRCLGISTVNYNERYTLNKGLCTRFNKLDWKEWARDAIIASVS